LIVRLLDVCCVQLSFGGSGGNGSGAAGHALDRVVMTHPEQTSFFLVFDVQTGFVEHFLQNKDLDV